MLTSFYVFIAFVIAGMLFFYLGCLAAARPIPHSTEWINYECGRQLQFCPLNNQLQIYDIIPAVLFSAASTGLILFLNRFIPYFDSGSVVSECAAVFGLNVANVPTIVFTALTVVLTYIFLRNLCGGYTVPIIGTVLLFLDLYFCLMTLNADITGATFFVLLGFYLLYRYTIDAERVTLSREYLIFMLIGLCFGAGMCFNSSAILMLPGIIIVYVIKTVLQCVRDSQAKITTKSLTTRIINGILCLVFSIVIPFVFYIFINFLCRYIVGDSSIYHSNVFDTLSALFSKFTLSQDKLGNMSGLLISGLPIWIGALLAIPCCIYQIAIVKDGSCLFVAVPFVMFILQFIFIPETGGLLPVFSVLVISKAMSALANRGKKIWVYVYLLTALLCIGLSYSYYTFIMSGVILN